jgi:restriction system protein
MFNHLLKAIYALGGSGSIEEINQKTIELLALPDEVLEVKHGKSNTLTEIEYRLAWGRTYLKKFGLLENSERGIWALKSTKEPPHEIDPKEVTEKVRAEDRKNHEVGTPESDEDEPSEIQDWKERLKLIVQTIDPAGFERLTQRLLRESGFTQVEVTGASGDGGIDGKGIMRINGMMSFHILFQCKRYKGSITPSQIRDFRGALQGRADKGLFITTGSFTRDAMKEASRDGASPIDLIDGDELVEKLRALRLGVRIETMEKVIIDDKWYESI